MKTVLAGALVAAAVLAANAASAAPQLSKYQTQYLLRCGGCHGIDGRSPPGSVPMLKGVAGSFLCSPASRTYVGRLPNVALTQLSDEDLAGVLNYVAFDLGGAPKGAKPFTGPELAEARKSPLGQGSINKFRKQVVDEMVRSCGAPKTLQDYPARQALNH